jgi:hypothetical protein
MIQQAGRNASWESYQDRSGGVCFFPEAITASRAPE